MESLPRHQNYKIHFDNWFSSPFLAEILLKHGFHSISTLRINRAKGLTFPLGDKAFSKQQRGCYELMVNKESNLTVVRWKDSKAVNLLSSFVGVDPIDSCLRYSKVENKRVAMTCPKIVLDYNMFM